MHLKSLKKKSSKKVIVKKVMKIWRKNGPSTNQKPCFLTSHWRKVRPVHSRNLGRKQTSSGSGAVAFFDSNDVLDREVWPVPSAAVWHCRQGGSLLCPRPDDLCPAQAWQRPEVGSQPHQEPLPEDQRQKQGAEGVRRTEGHGG